MEIGPKNRDLPPGKSFLVFWRYGSTPPSTPFFGGARLPFWEEGNFNRFLEFLKMVYLRDAKCRP